MKVYAFAFFSPILPVVMVTNYSLCIALTVSETAEQNIIISLRTPEYKTSTKKKIDMGFLFQM